MTWTHRQGKLCRRFRPQRTHSSTTGFRLVPKARSGSARAERTKTPDRERRRATQASSASTSFPRWRVVFGIEVEDDLLALQVGELDGLAAVALQREIRVLA